jgi:histidinol-phosphate/aromatic aminotransferase/cobyric acid decarboxylase-like protein
VIALPPPGRHGGDGAALAAALGVDVGAVLDLSASLNPVAPDCAELVGKHLDALHRYPDAAGATAALAAALGVAAEQVLLTNGGAEAIALVAAEVGGGVVSEPEFSLHPRAVDGPRWRSNPHNPTGLLCGPDVKADVWDEAFYQLATGSWTAGREGVVVGSLTKLFACPGLRIGYVLAGPELVARLRARQPEWSVNGLALAVLPDLLAVADLAGWAASVRRLRAELHTLLLPLDPAPSDANFVLCRRAPGLRDRLAGHGVLVRDCAGFGLPGAVRVAVPDERGLARLEEALCAAG